MNGCDFNLLCYGLLKSQKYNDLKSPFKHLKIIIFYF